MTPYPIQPSGSPAPSGDNNSFKEKLLNSCLAALMMVCSIAEYNNWTDLAKGAEQVKWILEMITLLL